MRVFIIHLSEQTCIDFHLQETNIEPLKTSLETQKISYEVFQAIYSKTLQNKLNPLILEHTHPSFVLDNVLELYLKDRAYSKNVLKDFFYALMHCGKRMNLGELGCYASHYLLWQKCVELNEPICVLEDDVKIGGGCFKEKLDFCQKHIDKLGYIRLMHLEYELVLKRATSIKGISKILHFKDGIGTQGYVISPKMAQKLLKYSAKKWVMPVDNIMDRYYLHGVKNYVLEPFAISEDETLSEYSNVQQKIIPKKLSVEIRVGKFLHKAVIKVFNKIVSIIFRN
ncbi:glycosyltransferase family 25 protein [Helicobacter cetorum]|uniref:glycosyltransferase family 25 protein n=1 Tax=Helicobacter cetorum TaxID=138563 RepID=UPI000CF12630|nr:glycosyltransferase family 25 protein [Helicobacter cetorum]